jgi:tetratricopeptide (TPR) repeat protein
MLAKCKPMVLALCMFIVAGCSKSEFRTTTQRSDRLNLPSEQLDIPEAETPKILPETHFAAGKLFEAQGLPNKAITQYRKAIATNHHYVEAYNRLGMLYGRLGMHDDAVKVFQQAIALKPDNATLHNNLGFEYAMQGRWAEAERSLRRALELQPDFQRAHVNLGLVLGRMGRFDESLECFLAALPEPDAYYNLGLMYRGYDRFEDAADVFEYVLSLDPQFAAARKQLDILVPELEAIRAKQAAEPGYERFARKAWKWRASRAGVSPESSGFLQVSVADASESCRDPHAQKKSKHPPSIPPVQVTERRDYSLREKVAGLDRIEGLSRQTRQGVASSGYVSAVKRKPSVPRGIPKTGIRCGSSVYQRVSVKDASASCRVGQGLAHPLARAEGLDTDSGTTMAASIIPSGDGRFAAVPVAPTRGGIAPWWIIQDQRSTGGSTPGHFTEKFGPSDWAKRLDSLNRELSDTRKKTRRLDRTLDGYKARREAGDLKETPSQAREPKAPGEPDGQPSNPGAPGLGELNTKPDRQYVEDIHSATQDSTRDGATPRRR